MTPVSAVSDGNDGIAARIISLEKTALERWNQGDPTGYLEISAPDVSYFDPFLEGKLTGHDALKKYYAPLQGKVRVDRYEMISPGVVASGDMAVLAFNLVSQERESVSRWNCTEVYRREKDGSWKIVQTHWSWIKPLPK
ncbi:MAG: DUF4440 domain-containing protein [Fibrobacteria bacterium]